MKFFSSALLVLSALASTSGGPVQLKRGLPTYSATTNSPIYASVGAGQPTYTKAFRPAPELKSASAAQQYVSQPAASYSSPGAQQYYQQAEPQAVAYSQPAVSKYAAAPGAQKYSFASQPQAQQYSSAADVSSFSYSSPVVSYNNLGFLHQIIGKGAGQQQQQQQQQQQVYSAAPSPKVQYTSSPSQYSSAQSNYEIPNTYQAVAQKAAYAEAPQAQYQAQAQAQAYAQAQAQAAQAQALAEAQAQAKAQSQPQQSQGHAITFQTSSPVAQKLSYSAAPSYQAIQALQKPSAQLNYVGSQQQVAYSAGQASPHAYETAAHSAPQLSYSQAAAQPQYYSIPQSAKYLRAGINYAQ